tara:strand:+ start:3292 stop:3579 length:288 start_codon:yes stop_codon:yes gene_type:complete
MKADTPIALASLKEMSPEEREVLLVGIRERRLKPVKVYEELSLMQAEARKEGLEKQWEKQLEMFAKELERADKAYDKLQARHTKLRALELEMEAL